MNFKKPKLFGKDEDELPFCVHQINRRKKT